MTAGRTGAWRRWGFRTALAVALVLSAAACSLGGESEETTSAPEDGVAGGVVEIRMVKVAEPGNPPAAIIPFHPGVYADCDDTPSRQLDCELIGDVDYEYEIGEVEITVSQYVEFLNTVDPDGGNEDDLYIADMDPSKWPKYGSIRRVPAAPSGKHYTVAYPQWADKPIGFANFPRAASFVNSITNGDVLSRTTETRDGFEVVTYWVRLSPDSGDGMYNLTEAGATRERSSGFVVPSQDEWVKAAYYDPSGNKAVPYWEFPTGPFEAPNAALLDSDGNVVNADQQPLSSYSPKGPSNAPSGTYPTWCPKQAGPDCESTNPLLLRNDDYQSSYQANLSTVGQTLTRSPWGTLDQGGNVVEWTDTIAPSPGGDADPRVWRRAHGGVANAPAYQLWISATGRTPEGNVALVRINPWEGFRVALIGEVQVVTP